MPRLFLLSPANCGGERARRLISPSARSALAEQLRSAEGAAMGAVFSSMSGLYFRGKLTYARRFADVPESAENQALLGGGVLVITPGAGLRTPDTPVTIDAIRRFATIGIDRDNDAYREPLVESARAVARVLPDGTRVVLLGSIASPKYVDVLLGVFGDALCFPSDFVGRGDMSRGGLLLRSVAAGIELEYVKVAGAVRHGKRPPKLAPK